MSVLPRKSVVIGVMLLLLLSGTRLSAGEETTEQAVLRCAVRGLGTTNPLVDDAASQRILGLIYEGATKYNAETGAPVPYIAVGSATAPLADSSLGWADCSVGVFDYSPMESWEDGKKPELIIFYDFEGVYWHDGVQMGIRDIIFSFHAHATSQLSWLGHPLKDMAGKHGSNYSHTQWLSASKAWESDDGSRAALRFVLQEPRFSVFEDYLSSPVLPYHIWGGRASGQAEDGVKIWCDPEYNITNQSSWQPSLALAWRNPAPVGSGPFAWGGYEDGKLILLKRDDHFYGEDFKYGTVPAPGPQPSIEAIYFSFYSYDEHAVMDLEKGVLDFIAWDMPLSDIGRFASNPDIDVRFLRGARSVNMFFNMETESFGYSPGQQSSGTVDAGKPLRKALAHCVDREKVKTMAGLAVSGDSLGLFHEWENTSAPQYGFDPQETINILRRAGYVLQNPALPPGDGNWWLNPDGSKIGASMYGHIELLSPDSEHDRMIFNVGALVVDQMRRTGLNVKQVPLELNKLWDRLYAGDFEMCVIEQGFRASVSPSADLDPDVPEQGNRPPNPPSVPSPPNQSTGVTMWGPTLSVKVYDPDGDSMKVYFRWAETDILIGSHHEVRSGETISVKCSNLDPLTTYSWYVTAEDHEFMVASPVWSFTTERGFSSRSNSEDDAGSTGVRNPSRFDKGEEGDDGGAPRTTRSKFGKFFVGSDFPRVYLQRPENYYFSHFHSDNIMDGPNFCGYRNASYEKLIEKAMASTERETEMRLTHDAMASLAHDAPFHRVYYSPRFEVYRSGAFDGFFDDGSGSLLNPASMANLRLREKDGLSARFVSTPLTVTANSTIQVRVRVTGRNGDPVAGASVALACSAGTLSASGGYADDHGIFRVDFTTPPVLPEQKNGTPVIIEIISASADGYRDAPRRQLPLMVFPEGAMLLFVGAAAVLDVVEARDLSGSAGFTYIDILVTDDRNLPVADASVTLAVDGTSMEPDITAGLTDSAGHLRLRLTAPDIDVAGECLVNISASKVAHVSGRAMVSIMVIPGMEPETARDAGFPGGWGFAALSAPIFLALAAALWRLKAKKRKGA